MDAQDQTLVLVRKAQDGQREAFDELAARYRLRLDSLIRARLGDALRAREEVEDIRQETILRAFQSLGSFRWKGEDSFIRWLGGIAGHVIQEAAKRGKKEPVARLDREPPAEEPSGGKVLCRNERFDRLEDALNALSPDHRQVILLARVEGLPLREVAERMGRSREAVRQMLWRALQKFKTAFGDTESLHLPRRALSPEGGKGDGC
jgi:RNA polymerase sigma-70 factor (ECF subfamily)